MKVTLYQYAKCGTCRQAKKWLEANGIEVETVELFEQPPAADELDALIRQSGLELKKFFNVSGEVYKEMGLKDKLKSMSREEQLSLLSSNGRLIKRPITSDGTRTTVGFKEEEYRRVWQGREQA